MKFIGKLLPVEGYYVRIKDNPPIDYAKSLTHLYQPLIGIEATMLYQTLLHEIELQNDTTLQTHHTLMNYLNIPLNEIYQARLKLEGIGLLRTFENKVDGNKSYIYELQSPYSPNAFFADPMLTELLYHHLDETKFMSLRKIYALSSKVNYEEEVTTSFGDIFKTFEPTRLDVVQIDEGKSNQETERVNQVDFFWLETMLKQRMIPVHRILTSDNRKLISEMMFLYDLATHEVEKSLLWALTEENQLDIKEFKIACHDIFKTKNHKTPIKLVAKPQNDQEKQEQKEPKTKEEQLIHRLETISPKHLLEDLSSGNQASEQDMRIIREVMTSQGLPAPVMNVLIHYVLLQSNMKLSKAYLEKIASHWSRANLTTAKEAMEFAKKEITKHQKGSSYRNNYRKQVSTEVIPDWFKERNEKRNQPDSKNDTVESEKAREELAALIQQYAGEQ